MCIATVLASHPMTLNKVAFELGKGVSIANEAANIIGGRAMYKLGYGGDVSGLRVGQITFFAAISVSEALSVTTT